MALIPVYLSPSTQDWNQYAGGGVGTSDSEEYWMRKVAAVVEEYLDVTGKFKVYMGGTVSWSANSAASNAKGVKSHWAIHTNAGGGEGTEVYAWQSASGVKSVEGTKMAKAVYPFIASESNEPDRGIKWSNKYGELNNTKAPCVIMEILFHDNKTEAAEMRADYRKFGKAIAKGICKYHGVTFIELPKPTTPTTPTTPPVDPCAALKTENADLKTKLAAETSRYTTLADKVKAVAASV